MCKASRSRWQTIGWRTWKTWKRKGYRYENDSTGLGKCAGETQGDLWSGKLEGCADPVAENVRAGGACVRLDGPFDREHCARHQPDAGALRAGRRDSGGVERRVVARTEGRTREGGSGNGRIIEKAASRVCGAAFHLIMMLDFIFLYPMLIVA